MELDVGEVYTGKEFNSRCKHSLYRITNEREKHHKFQYETGLNTDTLKFDPSGECKPGGLYFFDRSQVINYRFYVKNPFWIRRVEILNDDNNNNDKTFVYVERDKYKTNRFILHDRIRIGNIDPGDLCDMYDECIDFDFNININTDEDSCLNILKRNAYMLLKIPFSISIKDVRSCDIAKWVDT